ncbi:glucose-6-phosphate exchanger SLC37A2-like isoform X2 [Paramacrobiotus metropolitanus]|nr:glucose-6-phosphate exchanger SLC37A2-like isoform X2 [Paramacrobiotus metropolitanus]
MDRHYDSSINDANGEPSETTTFLNSRRKSSVSKERWRMLRGSNKNIPLGVRIVQRLCIPTVVNRIVWYRLYILVLTFFFYATYHLSRRPLGIAKNVLHRSCSELPPPPVIDPNRNGTWCDWAPFDKDNYQELFSSLDFTYWLAYAIGMFVVGHIAERTNLRNFLASGMIMAGFWTICFGLAYFWEIHSFSYFVAVQVFGGIFQATGWPSVVTLMGNWFGKKRLGLIFGIWNSHTSVGNILGAVIAGVWVNDNWGYSFIVPGVIVAGAGVLAYLFVVVRPEDVDLPPADHTGRIPGAPPDVVEKDDQVAAYSTVTAASTIDIDVAVVPQEHDHPISLLNAIRIPGVVEFSVCLFFAKAVSYTFLVWLPVYIHNAVNVTSDVAADMSTVFDLGGIVGGILAGLISDLSGGSATVCGVMFVFAAPLLYLLFIYGATSAALIALLFFSGLVVNGPYALITTAVSTDLGTHPSLTGNNKALATVTAIIDGTGSLGAAFGPLVAGLISVKGWESVFYYLIVAQIVALLCLSRLIFREVRGWLRRTPA